MEKGMAGDRRAQAAVASSSAANPMATVERSASSGGTTPLGIPLRGRGAGTGGPPSGSITHPAEDRKPQVTLAKDAHGTWRMSNDAERRSWRWDDAAKLWRGEGGAEDMEGPGPEDSAYWLSDRPNRPF